MAGASKKTSKKGSGGQGKSLSKASLEFGRNHVAQMFDGSAVEDNSSSFPQFDMSELHLGPVLGKGAFGTVSEVRSFAVDPSKKAASKPAPPSRLAKSKAVQSIRNLGALNSAKSTDRGEGDNEVEDGQMESCKFIADHCIRGNGQARYAVKVLSAEILADESEHLRGAIDMAIETRFLSAISHPNIIRLRAIAKCDPMDSDYFIVMDRLYDTLEKRLEKWRRMAKRASGMAGRLTDRKGDKSSALLEERVVAAYDLASAINYLHEKDIIYRDLKPENVAFDIRDDVKLFDFGLAKELRDKDRNADGTYNLTGLTGSLRYMAGEVANGKPYNKHADSYSFAILFWEMMALKTPFELYTPRLLREKVYNGIHKRPAIPSTWTASLQVLLKRSWDPDFTIRNTMKQNETILFKECTRLRNGDTTGLEHYSRRSTFVLNRPSAAAAAKNKAIVAVANAEAAKNKAAAAAAKGDAVASDAPPRGDNVRFAM